MDGRRVLLATLVTVTTGSVPLSAGDQPFDDVYPFSPQDGAASVAVADLDRDGHQDVVMAAIEADTIRIRFGGSPPTYVTLVSGFDRACFVVAADVDGDGWTDVVGAARGTGADQVRWWRNPRSTGGWSEHPVSAGYFDEARGLDVADLDGDGDMEILVAGVDAGTGYLSWFEDVSGTGTAWALHDITAGFTGAHDIHAVDIDGDGLLDVVAASYDLDTVAWFENDGTIGSPGFWPSYSIASDLDGAICVNAADMDGDGDVDVVAGGYLDGRVLWYESDGGAWTPHEITTVLDGVYSAEPVDLDRDGDLDVLAAGRVSGHLKWYEQNGSLWIGRFVDTTDLDIAGVRSATAVDFDRDGDLDVVAAAEYDDLFGWWENRNVHRRATFATADVLTAGVDSLEGAIIVDIDRDGSPDIVDHRRSGEDGADIVIWRQTTGAWTPDPIVLDFDGPTVAKVVDLDGDGDLDIVAGAIYDDELAWFEHDGAGGFTKRVLTTAYPVKDLDVGDLDCDGDPDIVSTASNQTSVLFWWNNGDASGWSTSTLTPSVPPLSLALGDLVGDGAPDLVVGGISGFEVGENRLCSGGGWTLALASDGGLGHASIADLDGDGRNDLAATFFSDDRISVYLAAGGWSRHDLSTTADGADQIAAADVDHDGDVDLVTTTFYQARVELWENDGSGTGWAGSQIDSSGFPKALAIGDLDLDGDPDVVAGSWGSDEIHVLDNIGGQYGAVYTAIAPPSLRVGETAALARLEYTTYGRPGDPDHHLRAVIVQLASGTGDVLSQTQASHLFDSIIVWHDADDNGIAEPGVDPVVSSSSPAIVPGGTMTVTVPSGPPNPSVPGGRVTTRFFVGVEIADDAAGHDPPAFRLAALTSPTFSLGYAAWPALPLVGERWPSACTGAVSIVGDLPFSDGFESGDTSMWPAVVP